MLNNLLVLTFILVLSINSKANFTNNGMLYVPYKDQQKNILEKSFASSNFLSATYMTMVEILSGPDTKVFVVEDSFQKSESLNILMFDSSELPSYSAALLTVDYSELQRKICEVQNNPSPTCEAQLLDIKKLLTQGTDGVALTDLGEQILAPSLKSSIGLPSFTTVAVLQPGSAIPTVTWGFYFAVSENRTSRVNNIPHVITRTTEVRLNAYESFFTKTEVTVTSQKNYTRKLYENTVYAKFPIKNKINLRGQQ